MTYSQAIDFIYSRRKFQKSPGHERISRLLELVGNPHKKLRFVHIVGTNGKGSVSTALASILQTAGYTVGLFTSPFVIEFGERIKVNGEFIPKSAVAAITKTLKEKVLLMEEEELYPTVFEVTTALAMVYFYEMNCDVVILEAGIGGKHDSTNVIGTPSLAVITSVSLDHTDVLGNTTGEIAREKCGIIKGGCPVVSYPFNNEALPFTPQDKEAAEVIARECEEKGSTLFVPDCSKVRLIRSDLSGNELYYGSLHLETGMCGQFQTGNLLTAAEAARVLAEHSFFITDESIEKGIKDFFLPGRLECVSRNPLVILDAGHNEGAMKELSLSIKREGKKAVALCAFMKDKDYESSLRHLADCCEEIVFTNVDPVRGESAALLCEKANALFKRCSSSDNAKDAFSLALGKTDSDGVLIVCGSFYLVSEVRTITNSECGIRNSELRGALRETESEMPQKNKYKP